MSDTDFFQLVLAHVGKTSEEGLFLRGLPSSQPPAWPRPLPVRTRIPRQPLEENQYAYSVLRPFCLASKRLFCWTTPASIPFRNNLIAQLGPLDARAILEVQIFSLDEKTRENYAAGLLHFTQYCDSRQIPEEQRMPASEVLLCGFTTISATGKVSRSCVDNWIAGLHFWHTLNGAPWFGDNSLRITKGRITKLVPESSRREKRPPVTIEHMHSLKLGLTLTNSFDATVWATTCTAFWSCCRLGELLIPSAFTFDPAKHVAHGARTAFTRSSNNVHSALFHIPWTKVTHKLGADIIITSNGDPADPLDALKNHLKINVAVPSHAPYFAYETSSGFAPLTRDWFMARCEAVWHAAGLPLLQGHAFRIGGATELLLRGVHPDVVAVQGQWKSKSFLEYWRKIEGILSLFISHSFHGARAALTTQTMKAYEKHHRPPAASSLM